MPLAFVNEDGSFKVERVEDAPVEGSTDSPRLFRRAKGNEIIDLLNKEVYYIDVRLLDESEQETTVRLLALDDSSETFEGGGGGGGAPRMINVPLTSNATGFPVLADLKADIEAAYSAYSTDAQVGDILISRAFHWIVAPSTPENGGSWGTQDIGKFSFSAGSTYWAIQIGPHRMFDFT